MLRYINLIFIVFLLTCGCSNKDLTGPFRGEIPNEYELAEMEGPFYNENLWLIGAYHREDSSQSFIIQLSMPVAGEWNLTITDRWQTRIIRTFSGSCQAGVLDVVWNLEDENGILVPPGIYWFFAQASNFSDQRKMLILYGD